MHDILRQRLMRKIESLPEEQVYQMLDYIEFLESKYGTDGAAETSGLQRFAEAMEDKLRKNVMSPATLREAFQLISAAGSGSLQRLVRWKKAHGGTHAHC